MFPTGNSSGSVRSHLDLDSSHVDMDTIFKCNRKAQANLNL